MARPALEIADIFRDHGPAWRQANAGHVSLGQLKVMSAIESCRTAALGGHVMRCEDCLHTQIAYNSCRNRHCPKCQGSQALAWMKQRKSELLDVPYFHVVFTLPARIAAIAYQNKAVAYDLLFKASSQTMRTIAADPKRLGVKIGFTSVLHTWGSAMSHHPHVHMIVPGGGLSLDGTRWIGCRSNYLLPVKVLSRLFRRLMLEMLLAAHDAGRLQFFGDHAHLAGKAAFKAYLAPLHRTKWFVYSKRPFAGPEQVLAYLSRYTHRVAISNSRLIAADATGVTFSYKDYRIEGPGRYKTMTLKPDEFIRRFLMHVLPNGFHRIRHCGLLASDLPGLPQIPAPVTDQSCAATSSANTLIGVGCPHAPPSCANLHSARRSRRHRLPFPAGSFIEGFRTPATVQAASLRSAGIRNPQQKPTFRSNSILERSP